MGSARVGNPRRTRVGCAQPAQLRAALPDPAMDDRTRYAQFLLVRSASRWRDRTRGDTPNCHPAARRLRGVAAALHCGPARGAVAAALDLASPSLATLAGAAATHPAAARLHFGIPRV